MADATQIDKIHLLKQLKTIEYEPEKGQDDTMLEEMNMSKSLLKIAHIDHENEYQICRSVAEHLLNTVPEPEEIDFDIE